MCILTPSRDWGRIAELVWEDVCCKSSRKVESLRGAIVEIGNRILRKGGAVAESRTLGRTPYKATIRVEGIDISIRPGSGRGCSSLC